MLVQKTFRFKEPERDAKMKTKKGEQWGSNPRPSEPQSDALTN